MNDIATIANFLNSNLDTPLNELFSGLRGMIINEFTLGTDIISLGHNKSISTLPYGFYKGSAVVFNDEIHILGSYSSGNSKKHYKWNGSSWTEVSTLPYEFYNGSAVVFNDEIHILGTSDNRYRSHMLWDGKSWDSIKDLTYDFYDGSAVVFNDEIHILGSAANNSNAVNHYIIISGRYKECVSIYLFKNQKLYNPHHLYPIKNCTNCDNHLVVTEDGPVLFGVSTDDATAAITII